EPDRLQRRDDDGHLRRVPRRVLEPGRRPALRARRPEDPVPMSTVELPAPARRVRRGVTEQVVARIAISGRYARRKPLGAFGAALVLLFLVIALFAPLIAPYTPRTTVAPPLLSPNGQHWLGTDANGFDVLSRVLVGSQISLAVGFAVVLINVVFST